MNLEQPPMEIGDKIRFRTALSELVGKLQMRQWTLIDTKEFCETRQLPDNFFTALRNLQVICMNMLETDGEWFKREQGLFRLTPEEVWDELYKPTEIMPAKKDTASVFKQIDTKPEIKTRKANSKVNALADLGNVVTIVPESPPTVVENPMTQEEAYPPINPDLFISKQMIPTKEAETVTTPPFQSLDDQMQIDLSAPLESPITIAIDAADGTALRYVAKTKGDMAIVFAFLDHIGK